MYFHSETKGNAQTYHDQQDVNERERRHDIDGTRGPEETSIEPMVSVPGESRYTPVEYSRSKIRNISSHEPIRP
jgi:hypothetical protein